MFYAFDNAQFAQGMKRFGLKPDDLDHVCNFHNTGGYYLKADETRLYQMLNRHNHERQAAIEADKIGNGYIFDMFRNELTRQEFGSLWVWDLTDTLKSLGLTPDDVAKSKPLRHGLKKALARYKCNMDLYFPELCGACGAS